MMRGSGEKCFCESAARVLDSLSMTSKPKPLLVAAVFCEKVLQEADGVLSAIRIVDKVIFEPPKGAPPGFLPAVELTALISLKSGDASGKFNVQLVPHSPSGVSMRSPDPIPLVLQGAEHGNNLIIKMVFPIKEEGLFWFDVVVDGDVLTKMPLTILRKQGEEQPEQSVS